MAMRHGGNLRPLALRAGRHAAEILDFSASINPLGPPEWLHAALVAGFDRLLHYPDPDSADLVQALARRYGLSAQEIVVGNGSSEVLFALARGCPAGRAVIPVPSYVNYAEAARGAGHDVELLELCESRDFALDWPALEARLTGPHDLVILGQPNNPTARLFDSGRLLDLAARHPTVTFVVDEAFADFVDGYRSLAGRPAANVVVMRSFSEFYAIPGLRLGFAVANPELAQRIRHQIAPWPVNALAQVSAAALLADEDYARRTVALVSQQREWLSAEMSKLPGIHVYPSQTNYLLIRLDRDDADALELADRLLQEGIAIRTFGPGQYLDQRFVRVAVRAPEENDRLCAALATAIGAGALGAPRGSPDPIARRGSPDPIARRGSPDPAESARRGSPDSIARRGSPDPSARRGSPDPAETADRQVSPECGRPSIAPVTPLPSPPAPLPQAGEGSLVARRGSPAPIARRGSPDPAESARRGSPDPAETTRVKHTPALMIQGTSSNAGKSLLTAALCRVLLQDGIRVAPFKAQNLSLNSYVTRDGGEMGRAQVVQAQACRLEPDVRMNPVLLKPSSDTGCQVIVRGKPVANMRVGQYVDYKSLAFAAARECYDSLAAEFDAILLEGAGSPGEVNLKAHDIVNMRMAEYAHAPVLIVGDIDRGGVFASFVGTWEVLDPWERSLVAGWIINRFRGDASLLGSALDYTRERTGRPVLGVVPYLDALNLPEEDSVEFKAGRWQQQPAAEQAVDVAVIDLPHISNFTDFDCFRAEPDVRLRVVRSAHELQQPDALILPGSKNTLADLEHLRRGGLAQGILSLAQGGRTEIVGICAGFQMLGRRISDPLGIESRGPLAPGDSPGANGVSPGAESPGLGLLEINTAMAAEKTLLRTSARHVASGLETAGYEIHHGLTGGQGCLPAFTTVDGRIVGLAGADDRVWGTYLHGVFDSDPLRRWFIDRLRVRRGLAPLGQVVGHYDIEPALDRLADAVRGSLRIDEIHRLLEL